MGKVDPMRAALEYVTDPEFAKAFVAEVERLRESESKPQKGKSKGK